MLDSDDSVKNSTNDIENCDQQTFTDLGLQVLELLSQLKQVVLYVVRDVYPDKRLGGAVISLSKSEI